MLTIEYVTQSILADKHLERAWLLSVFGQIAPSTKPTKDYNLGTDDKGNYFTLVNDTTESITDAKPNTVFLDKNAIISLPKGVLPCVTTALPRTTYGLFILNALIIDYPYKGKMPYINREFTAKLLNSIAYDALHFDKVTVAEHFRFEQAATMITCLTQVGVPGASRRSITPNPKTAALKAKLFKEHAGELDDPQVISDIQKQLVALDKEYLKGDPSEGFHIYEKSYKRARLRKYGMIGVEPDMEDASSINIQLHSLNDGMNTEKLPSTFNTIRNASYARGAETALGGNLVKIIARAFQSTSIVAGDCGTKVGVRLPITPDRAETLVGRYLVGQSKPLTLDRAKGLSGTTVLLRTPMYCKSPGTDFCGICIGDTIFNANLKVNGMMIQTVSVIMGISMALTHAGGAINVKSFKIEDVLN